MSNQSGFEKHNIDHSSPSSINMWSNAPCAWAAKYLYGRKFKFGLAPKAGILVEDAVVKVLTGVLSEQDAIDQACGEYNKSAAIGASNADIKRGEAIAGMIQSAVEELKQYGEPEFDGDLVNGAKQKKIELICNGDGWRLPVIGYIDLHYPKHGLIVDLKTTMRCPSFMSDEHTRQGCIYRSAMGNQAVKFLYVTGKKTAWFDIEDPAPVLAEVKAILNRQEKMLRLDSEQIKNIIPVNAGSFYWSDDQEIRKELYGV